MRLLRPKQDRPITLTDESQVCWLISLNCSEVVRVVVLEVVVVVGGYVPVVIALHVRCSERELTGADTLHFPHHSDRKCHSAL